MILSFCRRFFTLCDLLSFAAGCSAGVPLLFSEGLLWLLKFVLTSWFLFNCILLLVTVHLLKKANTYQMNQQKTLERSDAVPVSSTGSFDICLILLRSASEMALMKAPVAVSPTRASFAQLSSVCCEMSENIVVKERFCPR